MLQTITYPLLHQEVQINLRELNERFQHICAFDSNLSVNKGNHLHIAKIIAIGAKEVLSIDSEKNHLEKFQAFLDKKKRWVFGYLSYDVKNEIEDLSSKNEDGLHFPLVHFFVPEVIIRISNEGIEIIYDDTDTAYDTAKEIYALAISPTNEKKENPQTLSIQPKLRKEEYIQRIKQLKEHISKGDIYEVNFCQEFYAENATIDSVNVYENLNAISNAPFAAYCKFNNRYVLSASPERFIRKTGVELISQPIKGTVRRSKNAQEDVDLKKQLQNSKKERSENIMIVDLVRNDLSRIAKQGSVKVDELLGVYTFKQLHQLISTVRCTLKENTSFTDIIKNVFPMGSMTGAPKVSAMKLIEEYETTKRGVYSGAIGYITPEGDGDFSVVIRSILYNAENNYLSFMVGSAITNLSDTNEEYEECLLKAKAMLEVLSN